MWNEKCNQYLKKINDLTVFKLLKICFKTYHSLKIQTYMKHLMHCWLLINLMPYHAHWAPRKHWSPKSNHANQVCGDDHQNVVH